MTEPTPIDWAHLRQLAQKASEIPPPGDYALKCESAQWFQTKTGKPAIKAQYSVAAGPCQGMSVWNNQTLTETSAVAVDIFMRFLDAHGVDPAQCQSNEQVVKMMIGRLVDATIEHEEYQGRTMPRARNFRAPAGGQAPAGQAAPQPIAQQPQAQPMAPQQPPQAPQPAAQPQPTAPAAGQAPMAAQTPTQAQQPVQVQPAAQPQPQVEPAAPAQEPVQPEAPAAAAAQAPVPPLAEGYLAGVPSVFGDSAQQTRPQA